jgi:site-specific DNA-methyltransferase (adenine-specific)
MKDLIDQVFNEDCFIGTKKIKDKSIQLLLTDIPFGMEFQSGRRKQKHLAIKNDDNIEWFPNWIKEMDRICEDDAHLYIFCSHHNIEVFKAEIQKYRKVKNILIWQKNNTGMGDLFGDYAPQYEMVIFCSNGNKKLNGGRDSNIIKANRTGNNHHGTEKPIDLMEYFIHKSSEENDIVLDTFAGGGSTLIAAKNTRRKYIGFEIEEDHFKTINKRLSMTQGSLFS